MSKGTLIHGVAASEHLDSSGERISIKGLDISSMERGEGVLNYEHKNDNASHIVGKILKAKKIFSADDCHNEHELYFWNKTQIPFLYIVGELFDGAGHQQAKEIAAMLKYDSMKRAEDPKSKNVINFSIEGAKLDKQGSEIVKAIARKTTLTVSPCNKAAIAEELQSKPSQVQYEAKKSPLDMFKTEEPLGISVLNRSEVPAGWLKKSFPGMMSGTQALTREELLRRKKNAAEDAFNNWPNKDKLVKFIKSKNPSLNKAEAEALAKMYALKATRKAEASIGEMEKAWKPGVASVAGKQVVSLSHPEHGTVSVHQQGDQFHVKHNGAMAGMMGKKPIFSTAKEAVDHAKAYTQAVSSGKVAGKTMVNVPSTSTPKMANPKMGKSNEKHAMYCEPTHEGDDIEELKKPYRSEAQRRWAHTKAGTKALGGESKVREWDKESKGKNLPKKVTKP